MLTYNFDECLSSSNDTTCFSTKLHSKVLTTEHTHDFYEILFPVENSLVHVLNGKKKQIHKYELCLVTPSDYHYTEQFEEQMPSYFTLSIKAAHFEKIASAISYNYVDNACRIHYLKINPQVFEQCKRYLYMAIFLSHTEANKKQLLLSLVFTKLITEFPLMDSVANFSHNLIEDATELMLLPENMQLSIKDIAEKLGYSQEHLIRSFKKQTNNTPNKIFTKIKLEYAIELLCSTDYSLSKISESIGFFSPHYFNNIFKEYYGTSPAKYRKLNAKLF